MTEPQYVTTSVGWGVLHLFCKVTEATDCLIYTYDAADDSLSVDL